MRLTELESVAGFPIGKIPGRSLGRGSGTPRSWLEEAILTALGNAPCAVAFSGGRDSSALLALAVSLARANGLAVPIPVTLRFDDEASNEDEWQHLLIDHLGLDDWIRIDASTDLKLTGSLAESLIREAGVAYPTNAYTHLRLAREVPGGALITGIGGDEVFASPAEGWLRVITGKALPRLRHVKAAVNDTLPGRVQRIGRRILTDHHWLLPDVREVLIEDVGRSYWDGSRRFNEGLRRWVNDRYYVSLRQTLRAVEASSGCRVIAPFLDRRFLAAFATESGIGGPKSRTDAMNRLFGDVLPPATVSRPTKAIFDLALYEIEERFLETWNGEGLPIDLVSADALRAEWRKPAPNACADILLQRAFFTWKGVLPGD